MVSSGHRLGRSYGLHHRIRRSDLQDRLRKTRHAAGWLASISIALVESWRGRSIGTEVIRQVAALGFRRWSFLQGVVAVVRDGNLASARAFLRADFVPTDVVTLEDHAEYVLGRKMEIPDELPRGDR